MSVPLALVMATLCFFAVIAQEVPAALSLTLCSDLAGHGCRIDTGLCSFQCFRPVVEVEPLACRSLAQFWNGPVINQDQIVSVRVIPNDGFFVLVLFNDDHCQTLLDAPSTIGCPPTRPCPLDGRYQLGNNSVTAYGFDLRSDASFCQNDTLTVPNCAVPIPSSVAVEFCSSHYGNPRSDGLPRGQEILACEWESHVATVVTTNGCARQDFIFYNASSGQYETAFQSFGIVSRDIPVLQLFSDDSCGKFVSNSVTLSQECSLYRRICELPDWQGNDLQLGDSVQRVQSFMLGPNVTYCIDGGVFPHCVHDYRDSHDFTPPWIYGAIGGAMGGATLVLLVLLVIFLVRRCRNKSPAYMPLGEAV